MITILSKLLFKEETLNDTKKKRKAYGMLCSIVGICLNILLFLGKYIVGLLSGSVSIVADAINNLSDAGSSFITLIGFQFAGKKPDPTHPFGHGRIEYLSGLSVAVLIMLMGLELLKSSVDKIIHPQSLEVSVVTFAVLIASILVKVYMSIYNKKIGEKIDSAAMKATATDSLSDCIATSVVVIAMGIFKIFGVNIDGYSGVLVAFFILFAGFSAAKETLSPLLGEAPDPELVKAIEETVLMHEEVVGIHDMVIHDYGPGRLMISLHAEVPGDGDIYELHDAIDRIEAKLNKTFDCESVIHMDPIAVNDEKVMALREEVEKLVKTLDDNLTIHDFRMVEGPTHTNVIFDVVVPHGYEKSDEEITMEIRTLITTKWEQYFAVIKVDKAYA